MAAMTKPELTEMVSQLVRDCEDYRDQLSAQRVRAMEYYDGVMADVPAEANRSKVVSRDVRAAVKKVLPSLIRTVLGNDRVVEYQPVNQGDEAGAEQASDYINYIVFPESHGYDAVQDAAHDALKLGNGVIRWWYEKRKSVEVSTHSGLDEAALVQLITKAILDQVMQTGYQNGANFRHVSVSPYVKSVFVTFMSDANVAPFRYAVSQGGERNTIVATADYYEGPFGTVMIHPNRVSAPIPCRENEPW